MAVIERGGGVSYHAPRVSGQGLSCVQGETVNAPMSLWSRPKRER